MAADKPITITLEDDESISVPTQVVLTRQQTATWRVEGHPEASWLVSFVDGDPFDILPDPDAKRTWRPVPASVRDGQLVRAKEETSSGEFPYRLAFVVNGKVYAIFDCPSIIIR